VASNRRVLGSPLQRREWRLLTRDHNYLVQTLVLPLVIVGSQLFLTGRFGMISSHRLSTSTVAAIAFGVTAYMLMSSAFQTLISERGALWILYSVPRPLQRILYEKAQFWAALALAYPILIFGTAVLLSHHIDLRLAGLAAVVLLAVPIFSAIAVSLGVFGCDPLAQDARTKVRPTYVYLYTLLAGIYTYAIFAGEWWQRIVLMTLSALLAFALWQKAADELPYLTGSVRGATRARLSIRRPDCRDAVLRVSSDRRHHRARKHWPARCVRTPDRLFKRRGAGVCRLSLYLLAQQNRRRPARPLHQHSPAAGGLLGRSGRPNLCGGGTSVSAADRTARSRRSPPLDRRTPI
jgi:hypothetical protein